jgi:selenide, water dikinase
LLCGLPLLTDPNLIVGMETCDDAGVYRLNDETALIQTVDFFTPIVDDPFHFGQIAAANALSDVYAMGGRPLLAMNLVAFPIKTMDPGVLKSIIRGGLEKLNEAGTLLVGGHSIEDHEIKYGLSVTGIVHPDKVTLNAGARAGDRLLLTKPLGLGILATALKGGLAGSDTEGLITGVMATLNRQAAEAMAAVGAHGCTDITGFGLLGHLYEMARASKTAIRLRAGAVPLLPDAGRFAAMGIIPEGAYSNRSFYGKWIDNGLPAGDPLEMLLYDPQTSGGLLIAAPAAAIDAIGAALAATGYGLDFAEIGEVVASPEGRILLEP